MNNIQSSDAEVQESFEYHINELKRQYRDADVFKVLNKLEKEDVVEFKKNPRIVQLAEQRVIALQKKRILQGPISNYLQHNEQRDSDTKHESSKLLSALGSTLTTVRKNIKIMFDDEKELTERFQVKLFRLMYQEEMLNDCAQVAWDELKKNGELTSKLESDWYAAMTEKKHVIALDDQKIILIAPSTKLGTLYALEEIKKITEFAHKNNLFVRMDGTRFNNAAVSLHAILAAMSKDINMQPVASKIKGDMISDNAIVLFNKEPSKDLHIRTSGNQLVSTMRFIWVQCIAFLTNNLRFKNARHANITARLLTNEIKKVLQHIKISKEVEVNAVFSYLNKVLVPLFHYK